MSQPYSRRRFLQKCYTGLAFFSIASTSCQLKEKKAGSTETTGSFDSCDDLSGLSQEEIKIRETFGYIGESPVAGNQCDNCNLWLPLENNEECGKCLLFKGPVFAVGYCTSWTPSMDG